MSIGVLPFKPRLKKGVTRTLLMLILFYALLCASGCAFQRRLIYFPTKLAPADAEQAAAQKGFLPWRNKAGQIIGWKLTADTPPTGSVLIAGPLPSCGMAQALSWTGHDTARGEGRSNTAEVWPAFI